MSNRFETISLECLGPLSKCVLVNNMLINDTYQILKSLNASPIERLIIKTIEKLNDGKSSFIL